MSLDDITMCSVLLVTQLYVAVCCLHESSTSISSKPPHSSITSFHSAWLIGRHEHIMAKLINASVSQTMSSFMKHCSTSLRRGFLRISSLLQQLNRDQRVILGVNLRSQYTTTKTLKSFILLPRSTLPCFLPFKC